MKHIKLYENFDWDEDDFDYEDEYPVEIIGNQYFTDFLIEENMYDKFIESVKKCNHDKIHISSIKEINDRIQNNGTLLNVIDNIINWECAYEISDNWFEINKKWNQLCRKYPSYELPRH